MPVLSNWSLIRRLACEVLTEGKTAQFGFHQHYRNCLFAVHAHRKMPGVARERRAIIVHRQALRTRDTTIRHGISVTTPIVTVIDLASELDRDQVEHAINQADIKGLTNPEKIRRALDEPLVHLYFHDTDLLDRRRRAALLGLLTLLARRRVPTDLDRVANDTCAAELALQRF